MPQTPGSTSPPLDAKPEDLRELIDGYFFGGLDDERMSALEKALTLDLTARQFFARYALLHRDLGVEAHARRQANAALAKLGLDAGRGGLGTSESGDVNINLSPGSDLSEQGIDSFPIKLGSRGRALKRSPRTIRWLLRAAAVAIAALAGWWIATARDAQIAKETLKQPASAPATLPAAPVDVAWLVNAQNCQWVDDSAPSDLQAGRLLKIERGLAEIRFGSGAVVLLEGPARLELLSNNSARLERGRLTGKVTGPIKGFELLSPKGKVIDLGTEFGVSVAEGGQTDVYVFKGKVQAIGQSDAKVVDLSGAEAARIDAAGIAQRDIRLTGGDSFVREIIPPPVIEPRTLRLNFDKGYDGTITDANGLGTGLTHRLPGTGGKHAADDPNLTINADDGQLELTTTNTDINGQAHLEVGEYLGIRLADLGFTGPEDFEVEMVVPNIPALQNVGQFGLYAGGKSDKVIRGGLISRGKVGPYTLFMTNNDGGRDRDSHSLGLVATGDDVRFRIRRTNGKYSLAVENMSTGSVSTLEIRHPAYLDKENDLYVGLFGANTGSDEPRTLKISQFAVTVWATAGK